MKTIFAVSLTALAVFGAALNPALAQRRAGSAGEGRMMTAPMESHMPGMVQPQGMEGDRWVRVGIDFNDDGNIDRFEYIHVRDLERARQRSTERQRVAGPGDFQQDRAMMERRTGEAHPRIPDMGSVAGTIVDLREVALAGMDQNHLVGKISTPDGRTARVNLGPVGNLRNLNLRTGDKVSVHGTSGTIDDKAMLMAQRIEAGGRTVSVGWPGDRNLSRYSGEVLNVRPASFRDTNVPEQVLARVLLDQGGVTAVNLGPSGDLERQIAVQDLRGKRISFLAHPARVGDRVALVAEELRVDGRTVRVDWSPES